MSILQQSALSLAQSLRQRKLSCRELSQFFLQRIAAHNPELSAFVSVWQHRAMLTAARRDAMLRLKNELPPLFGVPTGIKDLHLVRGGRTRMGSGAFYPIISPIDDRVVASLRPEGMVFLGKLSTSEMGVMPVTEPDIHPPTRNPWDLERNAGGSSGGSAAAVAAGLLPLAHGSDGAGSIRIPSANCGLVGIKPSRHVVPSAFWDPDPKIMYTSGPIARGVEDAAALLDAMSAAKDGRYLRAARQGSVPKLRIGLCTQSPIGAADAEHAAAAEQMAKSLEAMGCSIGDAAAPDGSVEEFLPIYGRMFLAYPMIRWERAQAVSRWVAEFGRGVSKEQAAELQARLSQRYLRFMEGFDLLITPTTPEPAPKVGLFSTGNPRDDFHGAGRYGSFTAIFNITGQPAISIPAPSSALPIGVQLAAPHGRDELLITVARTLEQQLGGPFPLAPAYRQG